MPVVTENGCNYENNLRAQQQQHQQQKQCYVEQEPAEEDATSNLLRQDDVEVNTGESPAKGEAPGDEKAHVKNLQHPEDSASIFSSVFFIWLIPTLRRVVKTGSFDRSELHNPRLKDSSDYLDDLLQRFEKTHKSNRKLWRLLLSTIGKTYWINAILTLVYIGCNLAQPFLIAEVIGYIAGGNDHSKGEAYGFAAGILCLAMLNVITNNIVFHQNYALAMQIRTALSTRVFRKTLQLNMRDINRIGSGKILTLMSTDLETVVESIKYHVFLYGSPFAFIVLTPLMYLEVGPSCLIGIGFVLLGSCSTIFLRPALTKYRMRIADATGGRLQLMGEIIKAINIVKMYCWEASFHSLVMEKRKQEMRWIQRFSAIICLTLNQMLVLSRVAAFMTIIVYVNIGGELTPSLLVRIVGMLEFLNFYGSAFTMTVMETSAGMKSFQRLEEFLMLDASTDAEMGEIKDDTIALKMDGITCDWKDGTAEVQIDGAEQKEREEYFQLKDISMELQKGQLMIITGSVGSGKSSLLLSILGNMRITQGEIRHGSSIGYVSQESWIFSDSVRENITMGKEFNKQLYDKCIHDSGLFTDLSLFSNGDQTMIGERGLTLSGGQKARISLARAVYQQKEVYLLDDPLSAVDAQVGEHIFQHCICGSLSGSTRILVTHQLKFLPRADTIVILDNGTMAVSGSYKDVKNSIDELYSSGSSKRIIKTSEGENTQVELTSSNEKPSAQEEDSITGNVPLTTYKEYLKTGHGAIYLSIFLITAIICQASFHLIDWWLSKWTEGVHTPVINATVAIYNSTIAPSVEEFDRHFYSGIYAAMIICFVLTGFLRGYVLLFFTMTAAKNMHNNMFKYVLGAKMNFFDSTPVGIMLNRFSKDLGLIDMLMFKVGSATLIVAMNYISFLVFSIAVIPWAAIGVLPYIIVVIIVRQYGIKAGREFKRMESICRSPMFSHLSITMDGHASIKGYGKEQDFIDKYNKLQDTHSSAFYLFISTYRWMGTCTGFISLGYLLLILIAALLLQDQGIIGGSLIGFVLMANINQIEFLQYLLTQSIDFENTMTSVERVLMYSDLPQEELIDTPAEPPTGWPTTGEILFQNVSLTYDEGETHVLKSLSFSIKDEEKVGIVGRTGAGKSSIFKCIMRLVHFDGCIKIDGEDISKYSLKSVRSSVSVIPQDPVLFSGSLRKNLDPFHQYDDKLLYEALDDVELGGYIRSLPDKLECESGEGGSQFSVGQKQLICLARALLRKTKILIIDEATANVDFKTDELIQKTVRDKFIDCTVLTIAHRINTVSDCDRIMIMDKGEVLTFDKPETLIEETSPSHGHDTQEGTDDNII